ncbi:hypothetical protein BO83DRAFT_403013 [Aspergillus eucalypticola CBS 122712]|uniref:Glucose receptor Git3 N-terminal domain-containing protein n=1 Tax=Aspergillus eucalypticola (strain CBS 122712 / IBT 29274) TaxID=1448314 RepID=A0A317UR08_ASPEC|nr:uncharacterized protein BO83DRAFT_403013 [Aspergillus eucalypticola CBS 122712]PWY63636.1 hypothetical protein BO83DRAFT_403013 [Aspergillus eucalypticola CBS 122712]
MESEEILSRIILVVSVASMFGSGWIIVSFLVSIGPRRLPACLGISEFLAASNVVVSAGLNTSGIEIWNSSLKTFCSFNGLMAQTFLVQILLADYWILSIAICTHLILWTMSTLTPALWCIPWGLSILWAVLGLVVVGYGYAGGWCWFTSDRVRLFVNFIPRWTIILVILCGYTRLYLFLYRSHKALSSDQEVALRTPHPQQWQLLDIGDGPTHTSHSSIPLKKVSLQMMVYPTVYALIWIIPTSVRIYQGMMGKRAPLALEILEKVIEENDGLL